MREQDTKGLRQELEQRVMADPLNYPMKWPSHNPAQVRAIDAVGRGDPMNILTFGNGTGKTHALVSMWSALMFGTKNPLFSKGIFAKWPKGWPKRARLNAPGKLLGDNDVLQLLMHKLFPRGTWTQGKEHKGYYCQGRTATGWTWDVMSYDQDTLQAAGETKGLMLYSEPPPHRLFGENQARLRAGGLTILEMTPLNMATWLLDDYIDMGVLKNAEGKEIGKINHILGTIWDNCEEVPGGQLPRKAIELTIAQYPDEERVLREEGTFGRLQGRIYKAYSKETHEVEDLPDYHKECIKQNKYTLYNVIDPHDRKPFAIGWYMVFPNDDIVVIAEFPDDSFPMFHKISSFNWVPEDYARMIRATETEIGRPADVRWIDPNFGQTPQFATKCSIRQAFYKWGEENGYELNFGLPNDSISDGHLAVKAWIGDTQKGIRPKLLVKSHCANHAFGLSHYAYAENRNETKGLSEAPQLIYKDFPDLVRYLCLMNPCYVPPPEPRKDLYKAPVYPGRA